MQQKLINNITVSNRLLIMFLLFCTLLIAKSLFLIIFITILSIIIFVLIDKNVKLYVYLLKKSIFWLLFLFIIYIMIFRDISGLIVFAYKIILIFALFISFILSVNFATLVDGIYTLVCPLKGIIPGLETKVYNIVKYFYSYIILMNNRNKIKKSQQIKNKRQLNIKHYLLPRLFLTVNKISELDSYLKLNFYKPRKEKSNLISYVTLFGFLILFLVAMYKEVIL